MATEQQTVLGILGGSGVYQMCDVELVKEHHIETPFGLPSDAVVEARIAERSVFFLPRHGKGHRLTPSEIPYLANIYALKKLGVTHLAAVSAVGIMAEHIKPGDMVLPDQIFDRTKGVRRATFFGDGVVGHVSFADPFCPQMRETLHAAAIEKAKVVHNGGTYVCIEGPRFSSRAESHFYRQAINPAVIGMTAYPEAALAREAEISYALLGLATDYDCWHEQEEDVTVEAVLAVLKANSAMANAIICHLAQNMPKTLPNLLQGTTKQIIVTAPDLMPVATKERLALFYERYWQ